jgi:membrane protein required for colicin V production
MKQVDVALVVLLALFAARGFLRGFFRESFGLLALGSGILGALIYTGTASTMLAERVDLDAATRSAVAFVFIFLAVHTPVNLFGLLLDRVAHSLLFRSVSCVTGAAFGLLKGTVLMGFVLLFLQLFPMIAPLNEQIEGSRFARPLATIAGTVIRDYWQRPLMPSPSPHV